MKKTLCAIACLLLSLPGLTWACQPLRDPILDTKGNALVSVSVSIVHSVTGTVATLYSDNQCLTTTTNPTLTGSDGTFQVFIKDGIYDIIPTKAGYAFQTVLNVNIFDPVLEHNISLASYSTIDITATGTGAIDQIGATVANLVISKAATATLDKTCPSTLTLVFTGQGDLTLTAGKTFVMNCRMINLTGHAVLLGSGTYTKTADSLGWRLESVTAAQLGSSAANGTILYCTDCTINNATCAASSTGARATRIAGAWRCD